MPVTIWDLITQLAGLQTPPETGPVGPFPVGITPELQNWLAVLGQRDIGIGPLAQQFPVGYGLQGPARFPPQLVLDTSGIRDWRGARNPWTPWLGGPPSPAAYDPIGPAAETIWPPPSGYP